MADELNTPNHRYHQRQYNVALAPNEVSKQFIYASGVAKIDAKIVSPLFAASEQGVWFDPSDLTTLFQDSAGATPVTAPGQTVGLMLDKSQGLALGPELVTNGNFASATGWTTEPNWVISGGYTNATSVSGGTGTYQPATNVVGKTYKISFSVRNYVSGAVFPTLFNGDNGQIVSANGDYVSYIRKTSAATNFQGVASFSTFTGSITNISVKELAGNHATQATSTQRPTYGINPITGTRNLLTYTEQFDNAAWVKSAVTVTTNATTAPDGLLTADQVEYSASGYVNGSGTVLASATATFSIYAKAGTSATSFRIREANYFGTNSIFNLTTGTVVSGSGAIVSVGNGWYRCSLSISYGVAQTVGSFVFDNTSTGSFYVWGAQLELGSTATAYQKVVLQYEVTEAGVQSAGYLAFDGVDDGMVTNTITPGIDKVQVFAGVRKLSDAATAILAEFSSNLNSSSGAFYITAPTNVTGDFAFLSRGSILLANGASSGPLLAPTTRLIAGIADISADSIALKINGSQVATASGDQGTGNYLAYPLYIGRRGGTTFPFNGRIYSLITRFGANLTDGQIASTESWVNAKTGNS